MAINRYRFDGDRIKDEQRGVKAGNMNTVLAWLNELEEDATQCRVEREVWRQDCLAVVDENEILRNELNLAMEQGYKPSDAYLRFLGDKQLEYKYWIQKQVERGRELNESV